MTPTPDKAETVEQAAEYFAKIQFDLSNCTENEIRYIGGCFIAGAIWQSQQSLSQFTLKDSNLQPLFNLMSQHGLTLLQSEMFDIINCVQGLSLSEQQPMQGWISVENDMPEDGQIIDTWNGITNRRAKIYLGEFYRHIDLIPNDRVFHISFPDVTHWRVLPTNPPSK